MVVIEVVKLGFINMIFYFMVIFLIIVVVIVILYLVSDKKLN